MGTMRACHALLHYVSYPMTGEQRMPAKVRREVIVLILGLRTLHLQGVNSPSFSQSLRVSAGKSVLGHYQP